MAAQRDTTASGAASRVDQLASAASVHAVSEACPRGPCHPAALRALPAAGALCVGPTVVVHRELPCVPAQTAQESCGHVRQDPRMASRRPDCGNRAIGDDARPGRSARRLPEASSAQRSACEALATSVVRPSSYFEVESDEAPALVFVAGDQPQPWVIDSVENNTGPHNAPPIGAIVKLHHLARCRAGGCQSQVPA